MAMVRDCQGNYPHLQVALTSQKKCRFRRSATQTTALQREAPMPHVRSPHARGVRFTSTTALFAVLALTLLGTGNARADAVRCKREIAKASAKFAQAKVRILQKCEDAVLIGKQGGTCPDMKGTAAITKAAGKLRSAIDKKCGGADHDCTAATDNESIPSIGWGSSCPNFEGGSCNNAIADCDGVSNCLLCVDEAAVDQGIGLYYDALTNSSDSTVK